MTCVVVPLGPACVDITGVRAGDQNQITMTITADGAPLDLTGLEVTAQARATSTATAALDAEITVTDAAAGQVTIRWPGDAVTDIMGTKSSWKGVWDLQIKEAGSFPVTVVAGKFAAVMDVTRPN